SEACRKKAEKFPPSVARFDPFANRRARLFACAAVFLISFALRVASGNESPMITMFTRDGDQLIATHYCSAGNQPQMISTKIGDLEKEGITFALVRVTGMKTPDDWHNTGLMVTQPDKDHMTQRWTYQYKGKTGTTVFRYTRKQ